MEPRPLNPRKLFPPKEVIQMWREKRKRSMPKNRVLRFFKLFFGDGL